MKKMQKPWDQMTADELAEATKEYDRPETTPPQVKVSRAERAHHDRVIAAIDAQAKRKPNGHPQRRRPRMAKDQGEPVFIRMEPKLLRATDRAADRRNISRSKFIEEAVRQALRASA